MTTHRGKTRNTETDATLPVTASDRLRQISVTISEILSLLGPLIGAGIIGSQVEESSGGDLSSDATLVAPGGPAFSIWSVIYLGLFAYTIWQWLPSRGNDTRARATGWLVALSMLLNALWLVVTQQGWIWASVVVIVGLLAVLVLLVVRLTHLRPRHGVSEIIVVDGTFGLYLGWVCVATAANIAAALASSGIQTTGSAAEWATAALILFLVGALALLQARVGGRWAVAAASAWGLAWISIARLTDQPQSGLVSATAALAAVLVVVTTALVRARGHAATARTDASSFSKRN